MLHSDHKVDVEKGVVFGVRGGALSFHVQKRNGYRRGKVKFADGKRRDEYLHTIICTYKHGQRPSKKHEVRHLDDNQLNCKGDNLEWGLRADQIADQKRNAKPRKSPNRLKAKYKTAIRRSRKTNIELSKLYNVTPRTIQKIKNS